MKTIPHTMFNGTTESLQARVASFLTARQAHATTVGVPAPREEDFVEALVDSGEPFEVEPVPVPQEPAPLTEKQLATIELEIRRLAALRALDDLRLEAAAADLGAPQEVKDYAAARAKADISAL